MSPYLAEFIGTAILILLGNGVVANVCLKKTKGNSAGWIVIAAGWGMAVAMGVIAVNHVSGAHLNPAVTIGLAAIGKFDVGLIPGYIGAQMLGAIAGSCLVWLTYLSHWKETEDPGSIQACFCTAPAIPHKLGNVLAEVIGTAMLVFGVLAIGTIKNELEVDETVTLAAFFGTAIAPMFVGLLVFAIGMSLGGPTGYAINPARDLGPRIAHAILPIIGKGGNNWEYAWIPIVGPIVGGIIGAVAHNSLGF